MDGRLGLGHDEGGYAGGQAMQDDSGGGFRGGNSVPDNESGGFRGGNAVPDDESGGYPSEDSNPKPNGGTGGAVRKLAFVGGIGLAITAIVRWWRGR